MSGGSSGSPGTRLTTFRTAKPTAFAMRYTRKSMTLMLRTRHSAQYEVRRRWPVDRPGQAGLRWVTAAAMSRQVRSRRVRKRIPLRAGRRRLCRAQGSVVDVLGCQSGSKGQWLSGPPRQARQITLLRSAAVHRTDTCTTHAATAERRRGRSFRKALVALRTATTNRVVTRRMKCEFSPHRAGSVRPAGSAPSPALQSLP